MICLTGDLHDMALNTGNQQHCDITEMQVARKFMVLLKERNIKATFFITGRAFETEWEDVKPIATHDLVELGGHTYRCFEPSFFHRVWKKLTKNYNGPRFYENNDVKKTLGIIKKKTGKDAVVWRNHMYMHGPNTNSILRDNGIVVVSDGVEKESKGLSLTSEGIYNFPINIIPDHEHLYHAERTEEWVSKWQKRYNWSDDYGPESYYIEEWTKIVLEGLKEREEKGIISNLIIHPITMYLCDEFASVKKILDYIAEHENVHMSEVYKRHIEMKKP